MALVGAAVSARRPENPIGWILTATGLFAVTGEAATHYAQYTLVVRDADSSLGVLAHWYGNWFWVCWLYGMLVFTPLLFPTGRAPAGAWRVLVWTALAGMTAFALGAMVQAELTHAYVDGLVAPNPAGLLPWGDIEDDPSGPILVMWVAAHALAAMSSLVLRYRRSVGEERQQLRLVAFAAVRPSAGSP